MTRNESCSLCGEWEQPCGRCGVESQNETDEYGLCECEDGIFRLYTGDLPHERIWLCTKCSCEPSDEKEAGLEQSLAHPTDDDLVYDKNRGREVTYGSLGRP
jgi:hypothetical protein